jgi:hypothetical protein
MPISGAYRNVVWGALALLLALAASPAKAEGTLVVTPPVVRINSFFAGQQMSITADLPPGSQAVLEVRGKRIEQELMRKARHWDLWMNSGEVDIYNAPTLYMVLSSDPRLLARDATHWPWGYMAQENRATFRGRLKQVEDPTIFREFVELKERDELYRLYPGGLEIVRTGPGRWQGRAGFRLPSKVKPGRYKVKLSVVRGGEVSEVRTAYFQVQLEGMPYILSSLGQNHGVWYGLLAVGLAVAVGMLTGLVFGRMGGGH